MKTDILNKLETKYIGKEIYFYEEIESTQVEAKKLSENLKNGAVILANNQVSGIGTHGRKWFSEKGKNILFTLVLFPECNIEKIEGLTILIAECLVEAIESLYKIKLDIKHPNDLICNNKKIGGILTECVTQKEKVKKIYIGIGFNVNTEYFNEEIINIATSLKKEFQKDFDRSLIISKFFNIFEIKFEDLVK